MEKIKIEPKEFWEDKKWAEKNYPDLQEKYPDKWVTIVDKKVVAAGKSLKNIELEAEPKTGVPRDRIPVIFIEGEGNSYEFKICFDHKDNKAWLEKL